MQSRSLSKRHYLEKFIRKIAIATLEHGGVTSNLSTYQFIAPIDAWGLPRYPEKTLILSPGADIVAGLRRFIDENIDSLRTPDSWLGTWVHPFSHCCHLDIVEICATFEEARIQALQRSAASPRAILAIYNFKRGQTVFLREEAGQNAPLTLADVAILNP